MGWPVACLYVAAASVFVWVPAVGEWASGDLLFVAVGAGLFFRLAMFALRVASMRADANVRPFFWHVLACAFFSLALLWGALVNDEEGHLLSRLRPKSWSCALWSVLALPHAYGRMMVAYGALLCAHCAGWALRLGPHRRGPLRAPLAEAVKADFSLFSVLLFNAKSAFVFLVLVSSGGLCSMLKLPSL